MTIADFASSINACQPSIEQIKAHLLRVDHPMKERGLKVNSTDRGFEDIAKAKSEMTFTCDIDRETEVAEQKLYQLLEKTNIRWKSSGFQWKPPGGFSFFNKALESTFIDDGLEFAMINDHETICLNRQTLNIIPYFQEQRDFEVFARDLDQFFAFVVECHKYEMHYIYDVPYEKEQRFTALHALIKQGLSYGAVSQFIHDFK